MAFIVKRETTQPRSLIVKRNAIFRIFLDFWSNTLGNFWNLTNNPRNKKISNFNVTYAGGQVDINWGEGIDPNIPSNTNIDHTFGITTEGISIFPKNGANITNIKCGTSSPRLGGTVDVSAFPNLQQFRCNSNDITALSGYAQNSNLTTVQFFDNKVTGSIPSLSALTNLLGFRCDVNQLTGSIPSLSGLTSLVEFVCFNNALTGSIPSLSGLTSLIAFYCNDNQLTGSIPSLSGLTSLIVFQCHNQTGVTKLTGSIPSLSGLTSLRSFVCHTNQLTGSIPSLSGLTSLVEFACFDNQLTGSIPSLSGLTSLGYFYCSNNQLTGSIPSLSGLTNLQVFQCHINQLTNFAGGSVSNTLGVFQAQDNQLTSTAVNAILAAFVAAGRTIASGTCILNLGGAGNSAPTGQGITDKATLISSGWTVTTN